MFITTESRAVLLKKLRKLESKLDNETVEEQHRKTSLYTGKIAKPTMSNHKTKNEKIHIPAKTPVDHLSIENFPFTQKTQKRHCTPQKTHFNIENIIIDGESAGIIYTDNKIPQSLHCFSGMGLISALESVKIHPELMHLRDKTFPFLPGVRMFPHIAYPHAHDMDQLWPYMNRSLKVKKFPVNGDRIFYTPFRQIGLTNELIETDYRKTILNLAERLGNCMVISNHISEDDVKRKTGVYLFRFDFDRQKKLIIVGF